jgi:hypothetical protein
MAESEYADRVNRIALYTDSFIFVSLFLVELWVFIRLRFRVDKSGVLTLLFHLIASIIRILRSSLDDNIEALVIFASIIIMISLYYFTFEMYFIKIALTAQDY